MKLIENMKVASWLSVVAQHNVEFSELVKSAHNYSIGCQGCICGKMSALCLQSILTHSCLYGKLFFVVVVAAVCSISPKPGLSLFVRPASGCDS